MGKRVEIFSLLLCLYLTGEFLARKHRRNREFESLLAEYSNFKEKQVHKKAKKLLSKPHSSIKITRKKKNKKNRHLAMIDKCRGYSED